MYWTQKHVLVCTASHCSQKGANDVVGRLRLEIIRRKLDKEILVNNCGTIDLCDVGPNIVIYPDNIILSGVTTKDIPELVRFLQGEGNVDHLIMSPSHPDEARRRELYAEAVSAPQPLASEAFELLVERHGFPAEWISEQQRRGFIARKASDDGEGQNITVTSKARTRYGL